MTKEEALMTIQAIPESFWEKLSDAENEAIEMAVKALKGQMWTPCSVRLPEEDGEYLVWYDCGESDEDSERGFMLVPFWTDIEKFGVYQDVFHPETLGYVDSEFYECETAVAWMPLPEPYNSNIN